MKVVFDTNVLVSAFATEGVCSKLLGRARRRQFQLITAPFILKELEAVLLKKLSATKGETRQVLRILAEAISALVQPAQPVSGICRDPDDDPILFCAIAASADYLVTGDSDLLELREFRGTRIVSPRDFELLLED
ncbi:MAG: putative toxin-antitoxin system toxin component, PIN family [Deltaproteobacteria bacterium]|nr:putative toxin-antitoxin system toxin component, PIN family [Deltaproteobacteria bacterium]